MPHKLIPLLLAALAITVPVFADFSTGSTACSYYTSFEPLNAFWNNSRTIYCLSSATMPATNQLLTGIGWYHCNGGTATRNVSVYLKEEADDCPYYGFHYFGDLTSAGFTLVALNKIYTVTSGSGWNTIGFETEFLYHAGNNLSVIVCTENTTSYPSGPYFAGNASPSVSWTEYQNTPVSTCLDFSVSFENSGECAIPSTYFISYNEGVETYTPTITPTPTATLTPTSTPTPGGPGDFCSNAIEITYPTCINGSTALMGNDFDCALGSQTNGGDVVYTFTLEEDMTITLVAEADYNADFALASVCDGSTSDISGCSNYLGVHGNPSCSSLSHNYNGFFTLNNTYLQPGTYYFWIDGGFPTYTGNYAFELTCIPGPPSTATPTATPLPGTNCSVPIVINSDTDLPYISNETTCGKIDDYDITCLLNYDSSEDIIYQFNLSQDLYIDISYTTTEAYTGICLWETCPFSNACIFDSTSDESGGSTLGVNLLPAGTYYIMLDRLFDCYDFELTITDRSSTPTHTPSSPPIPASSPFGIGLMMTILSALIVINVLNRKR